MLLIIEVSEVREVKEVRMESMVEAAEVREEDMEEMELEKLEKEALTVLRSLLSLFKTSWLMRMRERSVNCFLRWPSAVVTATKLPTPITPMPTTVTICVSENS